MGDVLGINMAGIAKDVTDFLLIAIGSHGDVHPVVGIGRELASRGHRVRVMASPWFEELILKAGLGFVKLGTREDYLQVMNNPDVWHRMRGPQTIMEMVGRSLKQVYEGVIDHADKKTCLAASSLALGAICASEKHGFPMATLHLSPICIRSREIMPVLPGGVNANWLPRFMRDKFWEGADRWFIDPMICPTLNTFRRELGLPEVRRIQNGWWHGPGMTLGLWSEWFFPRPSDYPDQVRLTGFVHYDESDQQSLDPSLEEWLNEADKPIAFTPGSAMAFGEHFFRTAVQACVRLGRRGVLLTRQDHQIPRDLPRTVRHVRFAPFSQLLPHCAALVYHGGIGTTAQGLKAGLPLLIMPMSHDQFDNAAICCRLGVGDRIGVKGLTPRRVAQKLSQLLDSHEVMRSCGRVSGWARSDRGAVTAADGLEELAGVGSGQKVSIAGSFG
ncbi:MAG: rhamnosyltransferase subunit B [Phycisphaerae bacterium]|mgnify:CR=1 FL=1|nr:MAG: rhamnosyltransferase subunit B [Phycisphaerae bacterium]